jgi:1-acyl-sn-glycerol-3-phosphate acyltransferase
VRQEGPGTGNIPRRSAPVARIAYLYWFLKLTLTVPLHALFRPHVTGRRHIPRTGPAILACNHTSWLDWIVMPVVILRRRVVFLAKSDLFVAPGPLGVLSRWFFSATGQIPVDRSGRRAGDPALSTAARLLTDGHLLGVFPEGTRARDGRLHRGRTGVVRIAGVSGAPVLPCATKGIFRYDSDGTRHLSMRHNEVHFGPPMPWSGQPFPIDDPVLLRARTDDLMRAIQQLSGQEYVDVDARGSGGA